jgi:hypothetical protein
MSMFEDLQKISPLKDVAQEKPQAKSCLPADDPYNHVREAMRLDDQGRYSDAEGELDKAKALAKGVIRPDPYPDLLFPQRHVAAFEWDAEKKEDQRLAINQERKLHTNAAETLFNIHMKAGALDAKYDHAEKVADDIEAAMVAFPQGVSREDFRELKTASLVHIRRRAFKQSISDGTSFLAGLVATQVAPKFFQLQPVPTLVAAVACGMVMKPTTNMFLHMRKQDVVSDSLWGAWNGFSGGSGAYLRNVLTAHLDTHLVNQAPKVIASATKAAEASGHALQAEKIREVGLLAQAHVDSLKDAGKLAQAGGILPKQALKDMHTHVDVARKLAEQMPKQVAQEATSQLTAGYDAWRFLSPPGINWVSMVTSSSLYRSPREAVKIGKVDPESGKVVTPSDAWNNGYRRVMQDEGFINISLATLGRVQVLGPAAFNLALLAPLHNDGMATLNNWQTSKTALERFAKDEDYYKKFGVP